MAGHATIGGMGLQAIAATGRRGAAAAALLAGLVLGGCASLEAARLYARGTRALDRGDVLRAVEDLEAARALRPDRSEIRNHLGLAYLAAGRRAEAERAFEEAVRLDCGNRSARRNLVALRRDRGEEAP